ncbi:MAG: hypothetical protein Q4D71_14225 [Oscillospiraceae bacterium]|nr:hypothetical protein [Oscillospiraceae bacterium]
MSTRNRQKADYKLYIKDTALAQKDIRKITNSELENFLANTVIKHQLCRKRYTAIKTLLNGFWDYAILEGHTDTNIARGIRPLGRKFFDPKGNFNLQDVLNEYDGYDEELDSGLDNDEFNTSVLENILAEQVEDESLQYFTASEERILILKCVELYRTLHNPAYLAIIMCFFLGLRVSELVALTENCFDLVNGFVSIRLVEKPRFEGERWTGYYVSKLLKTDESCRRLPLSPFCIQLYNIIISAKRARGITSGYLFIKKDGGRMTTRCIAKLDMSKQFTMEQIRKWAGHARTSMTLFTSYFYSIEGIDDGIKNCNTFEKVVEYAMPDLEFVFTCIHFSKK